MGPNGSGKSTLAYALMGNPLYKVDEAACITMDGSDENILDLEPHERADKGIFLSFQSPLSLSGVRVYQLLQMALDGRKKPLEIRKEVQRFAKELKMNEDLLSRSLNEGASGGEKKKMEVLQAMVLDKNFLIFDEVDTGVDVDALKTISQFLKDKRTDKTFVVITHYNRILHYLQPDKVLVMGNGKLQKIGGPDLAKQIEEDGYKSIITHSE